jgi:hypothetical protein
MTLTFLLIPHRDGALTYFRTSNCREDILKMFDVIQKGDQILSNAVSVRQEDLAAVKVSAFRLFIISFPFLSSSNHLT